MPAALMDPRAVDGAHAPSPTFLRPMYGRQLDATPAGDGGPTTTSAQVYHHTSEGLSLSGLPSGAFSIISLQDSGLQGNGAHMVHHHHLTAPSQLLGAMQQQAPGAGAALQQQHHSMSHVMGGGGGGGGDASDLVSDSLLSGDNAMYLSNSLAGFATGGLGGSGSSASGGYSAAGYGQQQQQQQQHQAAAAAAAAAQHQQGNAALGFQTLGGMGALGGGGGGGGGGGPSAADRLALARFTAVANAAANVNAAANASAMGGGGGMQGDAAAAATLMQQSAMGGLGLAANRALEYAGFGAMPTHQLSSSLYIKNLPQDADKLFLYERFSPYGAILSVKVLSDPTSGVCRGVGFVNYSDHAAAVRAIQALHGTKLGDKVLHVSLQTPRIRAQ